MATLTGGLASLGMKVKRLFQVPVLADFARSGGSAGGVKLCAISRRRSRRDSPTPANTWAQAWRSFSSAVAATQESLLFGVGLLRPLHARCVQVLTSAISRAPQFFVESIEFVAAGALNLICERRRSRVRGFGEESSRALERIAHHFF